MNTKIDAFARTLQKTDEWLEDLKARGDFADERQAYSAFRAALHALRDRLPVQEATHLGAQLPMLVRGFYYEGWRPVLAPNAERTKEEFLDHVAQSLRGAETTIDPEHAVRATFALLRERVSEGEIGDVKSNLPKDIAALW